MMLAVRSDGDVVGFTQWQNPHNDPPPVQRAALGPLECTQSCEAKGLRRWSSTRSWSTPPQVVGATSGLAGREAATSAFTSEWAAG